MNYQIYNIITLYAISIVFWLFLVFYREYNKTDVNILRKCVIPKICNGWCFLHFIHYTFLGYLAPDYWKSLIVIGIIFELIEIPLNHLSKYIDSKLIMDTITNSSGVIFGLLLYKIFPNDINLISILKLK